MTDISFRIETANKHKESAAEMRAKAMAGDGNAATLDWTNKAEFLAEEAVRKYLEGSIETGDELFTASSVALEKASVALAA